VNRLASAIALLLALAGCGGGSTDTSHLPPLVSHAEASVALDGSPVAARQYRELLTGAVRRVWGLDGPVPTMAGQVEQESGWNPNATSPVGARGLTQFMPGTATDVARRYPDLGPAAPLNPTWALYAMALYNKEIFDGVTARDECNRWAFTLAGYNGGPGWVKRDKVLAAQTGRDANVYWGSVEQVNAGRTAAAFAENRGYPERILHRLQPKYVAWGRTVCL